MADEIDISHGGAISVDTERLRALTPRLLQASEALQRAAAALRPAAWEAVWHPAVGHLAARLSATEQSLRGAGERLQEVAASVLLMAGAYEIVELRARADAVRAGDAITLAMLRREIALQERAEPDAATLADRLLAEWEESRFAGFVEQSRIAALGGLPPLLAAWTLLQQTLKTVDRHGRGRIPVGDRLVGDPVAVRVTARAVSEEGTAPKSLSEAVARIPEGEGQIRVERYEFTDGSEEYFVHIAGTRRLLGDDPWNMASNLRLYFGEVSASYESVRQALADAGAAPGAIVHTSGHSQGAMIGTRVAMEGEFEVRTDIGIGNPVQPALSEKTFSVQLRHSDDIVSALSGGGSPAGTGSANSIVVQRVGDPRPGLQDLAVKTHHVATYVETAAMVDGSGDPRVRELDRLWEHLGSATKVTTTDYVARLGDPRGGGGEASGR